MWLNSIGMAELAREKDYKSEGTLGAERRISQRRLKRNSQRSRRDAGELWHHNLREYLCFLSTTICLRDKHISFLLNVARREQSGKPGLMPSRRGMQVLKVWAGGPRKSLANSIRFGGRDRYI